MKKKLFLTFIVVLAAVLLVMPCAFAEEEVPGDGCQVTGEEAEVSSSEFVVDEDAEVVPESRSTEEPDQVTGDRCQVTGGEAEVRSSEFVVDEDAEPVEEAEAEAGAVEETVTEPVEEAEKSEEIKEKSEEVGEQQEGPKVYADFTAADGSVHSLELGESVNLGEFLASLGYEGEVSSFFSSNSEALDVNEEGQLVFKSAFTDETITVIVNGEEFVIPVHDPNTWEAKSSGELDNAIDKAGVDDTIKLMADIDLGNTLWIQDGKKVTLDLNGHTLRMPSALMKPVIAVYNATLTLIDNSEGHNGRITGGYSTYGAGVHVENATFIMRSGNITGNKASVSGGGVYIRGDSSFTMTGGSITGNRASQNGGGVYVGDGNGLITIGGTAVISGNTSDRGENNLNLNGGSSSKYVRVENPADGMNVGITLGTLTEKRTGRFTEFDSGRKEYENFLFSDSDDYVVAFNYDGGLNYMELLKVGGNVALNVETRALYATVGAALFNAADGQTIHVLKNSQESPILVEGKTVTLDLRGYIISMTSGGTGSVITVSDGGNLTLLDSNSARKHSDKSFTGGAITGGSNSGVFVTGNGQFVMNGGTITGNSTKYNGSGVLVNSGSFTLNGGAITGNSATDCGGGVYVNAGSFVMTGGSITNNTAEGLGGGVYGSGGSITLGGTALIIDNTANGKTDNLFLVSNQTVALDNPANGMSVGVTTAVAPAAGFPVPFTSNGELSDLEFFSSDNDDYYVAYNDKGYLELKGMFDDNYAAQNVNTGAVYETVSSAIAAAGNGDTIRMLSNSAEAITVGKRVTLDLNGYILSLPAETTGSVITVNANGNLTLTDSRPNSTHTGLDYIGGVITGGNSVKGGGVYVYGSFVLQGGSIADNSTSNDGAGVYVGDGGSFIMNGGIIDNNKAGANGGGVFVDKGSFTMNGGKISGNTGNFGGGVCGLEAVLTMSGGEISGNTGTYGGGVHCNKGNFNMTGGSITRNHASQNGGGVHFNNNAAFTMTGGEISGNDAGSEGGGVYNEGAFTLGGTALITNNRITNGNRVSDVYLPSGKLITIGGDDKAPQAGMSVGVLLEGQTGQFTTNGSNIDTKFFFSDNETYVVNYNSGNYLEIVMPTTEIVVSPTASDITYGQALENSMLDGGKAVSGGVEIAGTFTWKDISIVPTVADSEKTDYEVLFTPSDSQYTSVMCKVRLKVEPREVRLDWNNMSVTYNGEEQLPTAAVKAEDLIGSDTVTVTVTGAQKDAGSYTATATALSSNNYKLPATATKVFSIKPKDISGADVVCRELVYTGSEQNVIIESVTVDGLTVDTYTLSGDTAATEAGSYTVKVEGTGNFTGSLSANWRIAEKPVPAPVNAGKLFRYRLDREYFYTLTKGGPFELKMYFINSPVITEEEQAELLVRVDGVAVDRENYEISVLENGDVVITFTGEFMQQLAAGNHEVVIEFSQTPYLTVLVVAKAEA